MSTPIAIRPRGIASVNPFTGQVVRQFEPHSDAEIERRLERAVAAFRARREVPLAERTVRMTRAAVILESGKREFARLMTLEMGKPLRAAVQEAEKCAWACRYYAENAAQLLADQPAASATSGVI